MSGLKITSISRFIISAWLLALLPSLPNLFFFKTKRMESQVECVNDFDGLNMDGLIKKGYFTLIFLVIFVIPLVGFPYFNVMSLPSLSRDRDAHPLLSHPHQTQGDGQQDQECPEAGAGVPGANGTEIEIDQTFHFVLQPNTSSNRASIRVNISRNITGERHFISRAKEKTTNLALTVVTVFMVTNLPYMVDEFIRIDKSWCHQSWCGIMEAIIGVSIVSNSSINPYIFLLFNSDSSLANSLSTRCCLSRAERDERFINPLHFSN